jgi:hypothetical protein
MYSDKQGGLKLKNRLTYSQVKAYFNSFGYVLLSKEYHNAKTHLSARCPRRHEITITYDAFQSGRRCAKCSKRKVCIEDVVTYVESIGYKLLSTFYVNAKTNLKLCCTEGHIFSMCWNNLKNNERRCPECQGLRRWTFNEVRDYFDSRGYVLLTNNYKNSAQKLSYICPLGHFGETNFNKFKNEKHGCDFCGGSRRHQLEYVKKEFKREGLILLAKKYTNAGTPLEFRCSCGNVDTVTYRRFKWAGVGKNPKRKCSKCMIPEWHYTLNEEERIKERKYPEYYAWVKKVKEANGYSCECCNYTGVKVVAHHLDGYSWCKEKRTDINNGVVLCHDCHNEFHSIYGYKNNTALQYLDFYHDEIWGKYKFKMNRKRGG